MSKLPFRLVLCIGVIAIILACLIRFGTFDRTDNVRIDASSMLSAVYDIAELSTAEFKYRGIAEIYKDENKTKLNCRICYSATVKASIDMKQVQFDVDASNKVVSITLPEMELKVTIDEDQPMGLLPSSANVRIDNMLRFSKEDAEREARESEDLLKTAEENLKATIEGLLFPILKAQGYSLIWN